MLAGRNGARGRGCTCTRDVLDVVPLHWATRAMGMEPPAGAAPARLRYKRNPQAAAWRRDGERSDSSGQSKALRPVGSRPDNRKANQALVDVVEKFAKEKQATPAQIALAWVLAQKPWIVPIPGTTKLHRLRENIAAVSLQFTPEDLRALESAASKITVQGARYPDQLQKLVDR